MSDKPEIIYQRVYDVPIIKRLTEKNTTSQNCMLAFHGNYNPDNNDCVYYVEARKICLVLDQENDFKLDPNYENYRCNYLNYH